MPVVVGFIPTAEGRAALDAGIAEAVRRHSRVEVMVHATRGSDAPSLESAVAEANERLAQSDVPHQIHQVERGSDIADDLIHLAQQRDAAMIVIGLRRRSPVGKLILGSNAQRILLDAPCPVLAVKPTRPHD
ncbi:MAG: universal stress protein [Beutenbergiaceae bacterium]